MGANCDAVLHELQKQFGLHHVYQQPLCAASIEETRSEKGNRERERERENANSTRQSKGELSMNVCESNMELRTGCGLHHNT
jgi:hypothetical protein